MCASQPATCQSRAIRIRSRSNASRTASASRARRRSPAGARTDRSTPRRSIASSGHASSSACSSSCMPDLRRQASTWIGAAVVALGRHPVANGEYRDRTASTNRSRSARASRGSRWARTPSASSVARIAVAVLLAPRSSLGAATRRRPSGPIDVDQRRERDSRAADWVRAREPAGLRGARRHAEARVTIERADCVGVMRARWCRRVSQARGLLGRERACRTGRSRQFQRAPVGGLGGLDAWRRAGVDRTAPGARRVRERPPVAHAHSSRRRSTPQRSVRGRTTAAPASGVGGPRGRRRVRAPRGGVAGADAARRLEVRGRRLRGLFARSPCAASPRSASRRRRRPSPRRRRPSS